jgi:hypothetical protein
VIRPRLALSALVAATLIVACSTAPARPHASLTPDVEPLRTEFNRDAGHVRIVMIAAPT